MDKSIQQLSVRFLGVGGASQQGIGHASAVVEVEDQKLLIDCGPGTLHRFVEHYDCLPDAIFITHCHLDHVGDFENFFIRCLFSNSRKIRPKVFVPSAIVHLLQLRVASYPSPLAEGGTNFWDAFQMIPVLDTFYFADVVFHVDAVRHHAPNTAFGLGVKDTFFYTGDTRPVPELINQISPVTKIFHDCTTIGNPSHTGIDDILREYTQEKIQQMWFYHYTTEEDVKVFRQHKLQVVLPKDSYTLDIPGESRFPR